jgi:tRNA nucleotidyltransferase (CCA-adding enzyme)
VLNEADVRGKGRDVEADLRALEGLKAHVKKVLEEGTALTTRDLKVNGHDLMAELQLPPGRVLGILLEQLLEAVTADPALNEKQALVARAKDIVREQKLATHSPGSSTTDVKAPGKA